MSVVSLTLLMIKYVVAPILVFTRFKRDPFILLFGLFGIFTVNTTLMAVIRDLGGMEWLKEIGKEPWFRQQYEVAYWLGMVSTIMLIIFLLRLAFQGKPAASR